MKAKNLTTLFIAALLSLLATLTVFAIPTAVTTVDTIEKVIETGELSANHSHYSCGYNCNHETTHEFGSMSLFSTSSLYGNRYLNNDITINSNLKIYYNMTLCLNGYTITFAEGCGITVNRGVTFELCDCVGDGEILQEHDTDYQGSSMITNLGNMYIYGGNIATRKERNITSIYNDGTMEIYGGKFGTDISNSGTLKVYDGTITGNTNYQSASLENSEGSTAYIYGGTLESDFPISNSGTMYIYGGKVLGTCVESGISSRAAISNTGGKLYLVGAHVESSSDTAISCSSSYDSSTSKSTNHVLSVVDSIVKADVSSKGTAIDSSGGDVTVRGDSTIIGKYIGIRSSSHLNGTNEVGAKCEIDDAAFIIGGTYGIYNSSSKSIWYNPGYTTTYISHSELTINSGATVNSIYVTHPEALSYYSYAVADIYIDEEEFEAGKVFGYGNKVECLNLKNENYYLYNQGRAIYIGSRKIGANGDDVSWNLSLDGVLTIFGTGKMKDFNFPTNQPWYGTKLGIKIKEVIIEEGITHIGRSSFEESSITKVTIPNSVETIGIYAFMNCDSLENVVIPSGTTQIQRSAFNHCEALNEITIPVTVTSIGDNAFYNCTNLTDVYYGGSGKEWSDISIGSSNSSLLSANIIFEKIKIDIGARSSDSNIRYAEVGGTVTAIEENNDKFLVELGAENILVEIVEKTSSDTPEIVNSQYFFVDVASKTATKLDMDTFMQTYEEKSIRFKDPMGMRFKAHILTFAKQEKEAYTIDEYGYIIAIKDVLGDEELTLDFEKYAKGVGYNAADGTNIVFDGDDEQQIFTGVLKNIPIARYKTDLVCKTYAKLTVNGEQFTVYGEPIVGNVYDTAKGLLEENPDDKDLAKIIFDYDNTIEIPGDELYPEE